MPPRKATPIERATAAKRESKYIDFKERFDPGSPGDWCEVLKDFAGIANSGGGIVMVGLRNNGTGSGADVQPVLDLDPAKITDKLFKYTEDQDAGFEIHEAARGAQKLAVIAIEAAPATVIWPRTSRGGRQNSGKERGG